VFDASFVVITVFSIAQSQYVMSESNHEPTLAEVIAYAKEKHRQTNHTYDGKPYEYHLEMVYRVALEFIHLLPEEVHHDVLCGCWVHDIIEDARETYNDVKKATNETIAEYAYALTNEKGRTRQARANDKYYEGIRSLPYAAFIKMCDRIANFRYAMKTQSRMVAVYAKEHPAFVKKISTPEIEPMILAFEEELSEVSMG
jgi:(p)ppGpp synthase/HD superfamily hydrolase